MSVKNKILIANAQGFWGDSVLGPLQLVEAGRLDYLTFDYLAEVSMSILQKQKARDPKLGYATDFVKLVGKIIADCQKKNIKIIANAAGVNPQACLQMLKQVINEASVSGVKIAVVGGDDVLERIDTLHQQGVPFTNLDDGRQIEEVNGSLSSANAYIGAGPIVEALQADADIVVTGRVSDPSLVLAPLIYEFGWSMDDFDKMAAGTVMGHILECGPQCTGGSYPNWRDVPNMADIGYPIIEASADGSCVVTKCENTGGLVNVETVSLQLLYELGDPENFLGPDCTADFTTASIVQEGVDRVRVSGVTGSAPTSTYKVSVSYQHGYKIMCSLAVSGPDAIEKAELIAEMAFARAAKLGANIPKENRFVELFGNNVLYKGMLPAPEQPAEIMLRVGAKSDNAKTLNVLGREIAPLITSGPPGITGFAAGRSRATEVIGYWPTLIDKNEVKTTVTVEAV